MSKQKAYAIYEGDAFTGKYALTPYEARKYCVTRAKEVLKENDPESPQLGSDEEKNSPLWFGQEPPDNGFWLCYGLPGPNDSLIHLVKYTKGWFSNSTEVVFTIKYSQMERVSTEKTSPPISEIVKSSVGPMTRSRDINNPRDNLLFCIENGVNLKSVSESPSESATSFDGKSHLSKLERLPIPSSDKEPEN